MFALGARRFAREKEGGGGRDAGGASLIARICRARETSSIQRRLPRWGGIAEIVQRDVELLYSTARCRRRFRSQQRIARAATIPRRAANSVVVEFSGETLGDAKSPGPAASPPGHRPEAYTVHFTQLTEREPPMAQFQSHPTPRSACWVLTRDKRGTRCLQGGYRSEVPG